jgi:hypothetical protein
VGKLRRICLIMLIMVLLAWTCGQAFGAAAVTSAVNLTPITPSDILLNPTDTQLTPASPVTPGIIQINPGIVNLRPKPVVFYPIKDMTLKQGQPFLLEFSVSEQPDLYRVYMDLDGKGYYYEPQQPADVVDTKYTDNKYHMAILCSKWSNYASYDKATVRVYAMWDSNNIDDATYGTSAPFKTFSSWDKYVKAVAGNNSVALSWEPVAANPGRVFYTIERRQYEGGDWKPITDFAISENSYTDNTAVNLILYEYRVSAKIGQSTRQIYQNATCQPSGGTLVLTVGSATIKLNGVEKQIDSPPVIVSGRTFVPIRALVENIGGTIGYSEATQEININYLNKTVVMQIGNTAATVNGTPATMDVPPYISDEGRTMIPLRFVVENLGLWIVWDDPTQSITIHF